jgi:Alpha and gamma adaptin binding protein p34
VLSTTMAAIATNLSALRVLILSPEQSSSSNYDDENTSPSPFPTLLTALTSTTPSPDLTTFAGYTTHPPLNLKTRYYERDVGIWCDELPPVAVPRKRGSTTTSTTSEAALTSPSKSRPSTATGQPLSPVRFTSPTKNENLISSPIKETFAEPAESEPAKPSLKQWKEQMLSPIAREVLASIGAVILILPIPNDTDYPSTPQQKVQLMEYMSAVNEVKDTVEDLGRDVGTLFVLQPSQPVNLDVAEKTKVLKRLEKLAEKFEDKCHEMGVFGWDFVWWDGVADAVASVPKIEVRDETEGGSVKDSSKPIATGRNEFGEKLGMERVREVLEGVDWSIAPSLTANADDDVKDDEEHEFDVFGGEKYKGLDAELQQEMMGLKLSMMDGEDAKGSGNVGQDGEDISIDQMSALMERVVAIRDTGADMEKDDREQYAKREVEKIMRELG